MPGLSEFSAGFGLDETLTKSGKRKAEAQEQQLELGRLQAEIARALYSETSPLRRQGISDVTSFLETGGTIPGALQTPPPNTYGLVPFMSTGQLPTALTREPLPSVPDLTAANREVLESQFGRARDATISQAGTLGGRLSSGLTDLEAQRAMGVTGLYTNQHALQYQQDLGEAQAVNALKQTLFGTGLDVSREETADERALRRGLFSQALQQGMGGVPTSLTGLTGASATFGNVASTALAESLAKQKAAQDKAGTMLGFAGGAGGGKGGGGQGAIGGGTSF